MEPIETQVKQIIK